MLRRGNWTGDERSAWPLRRALAPVVVKHHAAITNPEKVGELLLAIEGYHGGVPAQCALKLSPLLMVRPVELRELQDAAQACRSLTPIRRRDAANQTSPDYRRMMEHQIERLTRLSQNFEAARR